MAEIEIMKQRHHINESMFRTKLKVRDIMKQEAKLMFEYMQSIVENIGKVMLVRGEVTEGYVSKKDVYLVGRIAEPPLVFDRTSNNNGTITAEGHVFLTDYEVRIGNCKDIDSREIIHVYDSQFPLKLWDFVYPRRFEYDRKEIPILDIKVPDYGDILLESLEKAYSSKEPAKII